MGGHHSHLSMGQGGSWVEQRRNSNKCVNLLGAGRRSSVMYHYGKPMRVGDYVVYAKNEYEC